MADGSGRLGDIELTDPQAMRALAHPVRLAILDRLRRYGPATATELSPAVGATPSVTSWHLRHLAGFGLVRDSEPGPDARTRRWESASRGFRFAAPADPTDAEGVSAARVLTRYLLTRSVETLRRWAEDVEPDLPAEWRRLAGLSDTRLVVSGAELEHILDAIEVVLAPYVLRDPGERSAGSRGIRLLRYVLPESDDDSGPGDGEPRPDSASDDDPGPDDPGPDDSGPDDSGLGDDSAGDA
jgi:DNA-binding transcriptional ArsR family regulator